MTVKRRYPYGPIDDRRLAAFESGLPAPLPAAYRAFLVDFNGAEFEEGANFDEIVGGTSVGELFGLHGGPLYLCLDRTRERFAGAVPDSPLVIGSDPFGNYFAMDLAGGQRGAVFFVDHEQLPAELPTLVEVAPSFEAFLARAGGDVRAAETSASVVEAIEQRDAEGLRAILQSGVDAEGLVHAALRSRSLEIVTLVLEHGGDPNERGGIGGETPLFVAARENRPDVAQLLVARGADVDARCNIGGTAMEMATHSPEVLEILVRAGATPATRQLREAVRMILGG